MEEADILSDRVVVLGGGVVRAEGSSLELKLKHGTGYTVTFLLREESAKEAKALISQLFPFLEEDKRAGLSNRAVYKMG